MIVLRHPTDLPSPVGRLPGSTPGGRLVLHELREILPPTIFFFIGFNLIVLTTNLILADYLVAFGNFMLATAAALVVGKACWSPTRCLFSAATIGAADQPILFKTAVYWAVVFIAPLARAFRAVLAHRDNPPGDFLSHMMATFSWHRFAAIQIWILVLFLIYVTASELNHLFGDGELRRLLFTHRPSELQLKPATTHPRARPPEPSCRRAFGR